MNTKEYRVRKLIFGILTLVTCSRAYALFGFGEDEIKPLVICSIIESGKNVTEVNVDPHNKLTFATPGGHVVEAGFDPRLDLRSFFVDIEKGKNTDPFSLDNKTLTEVFGYFVGEKTSGKMEMVAKADGVIVACKGVSSRSADVNDPILY
jgi:hypothetical protein